MRHAARAALLAALLSAAGGAAARSDQPSTAHYPPWPGEAGDDVADRGLAFTVPEADVLADFHGDPTTAKLVLYVGGNVFFAIGPLVQAFEAAHPELKGRIFWETIPPGRLAEQLEAGGRITIGNMTFTAKADAYLAGLRQVRALVAAGALRRPIVAYAANTLTIMVPKANPARVTGLGDLGRERLRLAMPNPAFEGVARQIETALAKAGGPALVKAVYAAKVADGSTILTQIHHRQTPLFLMQGRADAGVTWRSEALFQEAIGQPIGHVEIPAAQNARGTYAGALVSGAAHPTAAKAWLDFVASPTALAVLERYGFEPCRGDEGPPAEGGDP